MGRTGEFSMMNMTSWICRASDEGICEISYPTNMKIEAPCFFLRITTRLQYVILLKD